MRRTFFNVSIFKDKLDLHKTGKNVNLIAKSKFVYWPIGKLVRRTTLNMPY